MPAGSAAPAAPGSPAASPFADTPAQRALACTGCHGDQGRSTPDGYVPRLAGKPAGYLFDQLQAFRDGRRQHRGMARLLQNTDDALLWQLAGFFASQEVPYPPPTARAASVSAAARAQQIVQQGLPNERVPACAACHGVALRGDGQVPGLLGLPAEYLLSQLGAWRQGLRQAREPDCMADVARRLPAADVALVAAWLAAQPVPAAAGSRAELPVPSPAERPGVSSLHGLKCAPQPVPAAAAGVQGSSGRAGEALPAGVASDRDTRSDAGAQVARGAYLARLGNCAGCHRRPGSQELSGGPALNTPFGAVYAGNLTPDVATGLGGWTADDFWRALHLGRGRDGRRLVPAFPYTSYTQIPRSDSDALWAYFQSLAPVQRRRPEHQLRFPYGTQAALAVWQTLYLRPGQPAAAAPPDPVLARGRYLVEGIGHCLECHAPRGRWGQRADVASGAVMPMRDGWAPSLQPRPGQRIEDIVAYLRTGRHAHDAALGPMARVVSESTQHWSAPDLQAAARYLMSLPVQPAAGLAAAASLAPAEQRARGQRLYARHCAQCHGEQGEGVVTAAKPGGPAGAALPSIVPLAGNPSVTQPAVHNLVQWLRHGGFGAVTAAHPYPFGMPPQAMSRADQAALLTFLRQSWGHRASAVTELDLVIIERGSN